MKKVFLFLAIALLASCSNEDVLTPQDSNQAKDGQMGFFAKNPVISVSDALGEDANLRTTYSNEDGFFKGFWAKDDTLAVVIVDPTDFFGDADGHAYSFSYVDNDLFKLTSNITWAHEFFEDGDYIAFYPAPWPGGKSSYWTGSASGYHWESILFTLPSQTQSESGSADHFKDCDFIFTDIFNLSVYGSIVAVGQGIGKPVGSHVEGFTGVPAIEKYNHATSFLKFCIPFDALDGRGENIRRITVDVTNDILFRNITLEADGKILMNGLSIDKVTLSIDNGEVTEDGFTAYVAILADTAADYSTAELTLSLTTEKGTITSAAKDLSPLVKDLKPGFQGGTLYPVKCGGWTFEEFGPWDCGTASEPDIKGKIIEIYSAEELAWVRDESVGGNDFNGFEIHLMSDIDLNGCDWTPFSTFRGKFYGDTHKISNLTIAPSGAALFANNYGLIDGLTVENVQIPTVAAYIGGIVGINLGEINNCKVIGGAIKGRYIGGIVGRNRSTGIINNCTVDALAIVSANPTDGNAGGIAGTNTGLIEKCIVGGEDAVSITSVFRAGGIAGENGNELTTPNEAGFIKRCEFQGTVQAVEGTGGIAGRNFVGGSSIEGCKVTGETSIISTGSTFPVAGGIAGQNAAGTTIFGSSFGGELIQGKYAGGIAGWNGGKIAVCQYLPNEGIEGSSETGGIAGRNANAGSKIVSCWSYFEGDFGIVGNNLSTNSGYCVAFDTDNVTDIAGGSQPLSPRMSIENTDAFVGADDYTLREILDHTSTVGDRTSVINPAKVWSWKYSPNKEAFKYIIEEL